MLFTILTLYFSELACGAKSAGALIRSFVTYDTCAGVSIEGSEPLMVLLPN